jgi:hypothetical protein
VSLTPKLINSGTSFVKKHLQRRKTIHDIINFDIINNLISNSSFSTNNDNTTSTDKSQQSNSKQKLSKNNSYISTDKALFNKIDKTKNQQQPSSNSYSFNPNSPNLNQENYISRELIIQGPVQLLNVMQKHAALIYFQNFSRN